MHLFLAVLAVPAFVLLFILNSVSANPRTAGIEDPSVPFFLTLISALSYSVVAFVFLRALGWGSEVKHLWLTCLPFSLILATAVHLYSTRKRENPGVGKRAKIHVLRLLHPFQRSALHPH